MAEKPEKKKEIKAPIRKAEEKVMVIPLRYKARRSARNKRMNRTVREIRAFLSKHMKVAPSQVSISQQLNESLWKGGFHNPPSRIKVKVSADEEGNVTASLIDEKEKPKKARKKPGLRQRLTGKREDAGKKSGQPASDEEAKAEKPAPAKPDVKKEAKKPAERTEPRKENPVPEGTDQDFLEE